MTEVLYNPKIKPEHLARQAIVYVRHFEPEPGHRFESQKGFSGVASGSVGTGRGSRSSGLEVAQTLLVRFEDIEPWCSDFDDQAATEWSAHRFPIRANGQQRRVEANGE